MDTLALIGNTPLVRLRGFDTGPCELYAKLESQNPGGSIKDRVALSMIEDAERRGLIKPGSTLVEATAGNTGIGLALVGSQKGYRTILVVPDKMSREKISHLRALGAEVVLTRSDVGQGHPDYYQDKARALAWEIPGAWFVDQFSNPANPLAHEQTTGPEILKQMNGDLDAVVVGVGSGGTIGGLTKFFAEHSPKTEMVLADPVGSILVNYVETGEVSADVGSWLVEGIGEDFIPLNSDFSKVNNAYAVSDRDSFIAARNLLHTNGILAGSSSGTLLAAALRFCQEQTEKKRVVTLVCDGGSKYLSKMFNDQWMADQGYLTHDKFQDLRDLISCRFVDGTLVVAEPQETLRSVYTRMRSYDVSQIPVVKDKKIVGIIDESDLLFALQKDQAALKHSVADVMSVSLEVLAPDDSIEQVIALFHKGFVAIVADDQEFFGIITKMDLVEYLRQQNS